MRDFRSIDEFLRSIQPHLEPSTEAHRSAHALELLDQTVEALKIAARELRVMREQLAEDAPREHDGPRALPAGAFRHAFAAAPVPMLITDETGSVRFANAAAGALIGAAVQELEGKPLAAYVAQNGRRAFRHFLAHLAVDAAPCTVEFPLQPRKRLAAPAHARVWPVPGPGGLAFAWSLAEGPLAPAGAEDGGAVARAALDSLPLGVAAMDRDGSVLAWNRAAAELLGWTEEEVIGRDNHAVSAESAL